MQAYFKFQRCILNFMLKSTTVICTILRCSDFVHRHPFQGRQVFQVSRNRICSTPAAVRKQQRPRPPSRFLYPSHLLSVALFSHEAVLVGRTFYFVAPASIIILCCVIFFKLLVTKMRFLDALFFSWHNG